VVDARPKAAPRVNENRDATGTSGIRTIQTQDRYTEAALRRKIEIETSDEAHVCKECEPQVVQSDVETVETSERSQKHRFFSFTVGPERP
jgi:hypothetical protein